MKEGSQRVEVTSDRASSAIRQTRREGADVVRADLFDIRGESVRLEEGHEAADSPFVAIDLAVGQTSAIRQVGQELLPDFI